MSSNKGVHVFDLLDSYVKGTLGKSFSEKVKTHLIFCNICRDRLKQLESDLSAKTSLKNEIPLIPHKEKILPDSLEPLPKGMDWRFPLTSAAVVVGIIALYSVLRSRPEPKITTPPEETKPVETGPAPEIQQPTPLKIEKTNPPKIRTKNFEEVSGDESGIDELTEQLVSNDEDWKALWNRHVKNSTEKQTAPAVNFDQNDVVAIFAGSKPSAGYSVKITQKENTAWNGAPARVFIYQIDTPPAGEPSTVGLTSPYLMKVVPKFNGPTFFRINAPFQTPPPEGEDSGGGSSY